MYACARDSYNIMLLHEYILWIVNIRLSIIKLLPSVVLYMPRYLQCFVHSCSIPANTAVYQSAAAFVFIISIPLLRERVTLIKVSYMVLRIKSSYRMAKFFSKFCSLTNTTFHKKKAYGQASLCYSWMWIQKLCWPEEFFMAVIWYLRNAWNCSTSNI